MSDSMRRDPDGRPPQFSPAQDALILIHERIVDAELEFGGAEDGDEFGGGWERSGRGRITTRLVVPRSHVGCLLGKGGKIIEQMRMETKTHIRILPRDQYTPQCVSPSEEVVQVVGDGICVKKAVEIISSRLLESLHRDRGPFRGRLHSPEHYFPHDDDFINNAQNQSALEGFDVGSRSSAGANRARTKLPSSNSSRFAFDSDGNQAIDNSQSLSSDDIIFRILCPNKKVETVMGASDGIIEMLRSDIGVDVKVCDPVPGSDERVIVITSEEGPDDDLFPAQEALLHIQTNIVDLGPDKDNIITTRLLVPASEIGCLEGRDGSLSDIQKLTSANVQILPKEDHPLCAMDADELVQIVGEIRAARNALVQITARLRSHLFRDISIPKDLLAQSNSASNQASSVSAVEPRSPIKNSPLEGYQGSDPSASVRHNTHAAPTTWQSKETGGVASGPLEQDDSTINDEGRRSMPRRLSAPLVTKTTLEVIIPEHAVRSLTMRSGSKLAQISELSGATVSLLEDGSEQTDKVVKISGTPDQAERAQSLLQGFILSTQDDVPMS